MPDLLGKEATAKRLNMSVRRLMERSAEGMIKRHKARDPETGRPGVMFLVADVERLSKAFDAVQVRPAAKPIDAKFERVEPAAAPPPREPLLLGSGKTEVFLHNWLTMSDAAEYSGLPARIVRSLVKSGKLHALPVGLHRVRIRKADLDAIETENCAHMFTKSDE